MIEPRISPELIGKIHDKTLRVLQEVGVEFESPKAVQLFQTHGAKTEGSKVYIPESLLQKCLSSTVRSFEVQGLSSAVTIGGGSPVMVGSSNAVFLLRDNNAVTPKTEDFIRVLKLCDASRVLSMVNTQHLYASDIPPEAASAVKTALTLWHTSKPVITYCDTYEGAVQSLSIARDFYGARGGYYALGVGNMISPLRYSRESCGSIEAYAEYGQPIVLACCPSCGMTSPITVGGTLIQTNAEILAGIVYAQLLKPGLPVVYGNVSAGLDMRYMTSATAAFEAFAMIPYVKALADYYRLPARAGGALSDSKEVDYQAGAESAAGILTSLSWGLDFLFHMAGETDSYNVYSMEKQVLDEEILERCLFSINADYFSDLDADFETIQNTGPGGQYLMEERTLELYKTAMHMPRLSHREPYATWAAAGKQTVLDAASAEVKRRLEAYRAPDLSDCQKKLILGVCGKYGISF